MLFGSIGEVNVSEAAIQLYCDTETKVIALIELSKTIVHNAAYVLTSCSGLHQGMWN